MAWWVEGAAGVPFDAVVIAVIVVVNAVLGYAQQARAESLENARTAGFTVLVLAQLFNALNARSETGTAFRGMFSKSRWEAVALSAVLQVAVVHLPFLNRAFGTEPLSWEQWLVCVAMASTVLWLAEVRKLVLRLVSR